VFMCGSCGEDWWNIIPQYHCSPQHFIHFQPPQSRSILNILPTETFVR
jgi:hypothetical protein